jgi:hypothetical protein
VFGLAPSSLSLGFAPLVGFCCCVDNIKILGVLVGFASSVHPFCKGLLVRMFTMLMCEMPLSLLWKMVDFMFYVSKPISFTICPLVFTSISWHCGFNKWCSNVGWHCHQ